MLRTLISGLLLAAGPLCAQTVDPAGAASLVLTGNFAAVEVVASPDDQIHYTHTVTVNGATLPDLGKVAIDRGNGELTLREAHPTQEEIGELCRDGQTRRYRDHCNSEIRLRVAVPAGLPVAVETVYGGITVTDLAGLTAARSTYGVVTVKFAAVAPPATLDLYSNYGDVDLALPADVAAEVELETQYGSLLTDCDIDIDAAASERRAFFERVVGSLGAGGGTRVTCRSPYDTVYLRRSE